MNFTQNLDLMLQENKIDLSIENGIFIGGGSKLLKPYFNNLFEPYFIEDVNANAKGYELLASRLAKKQKG